MVEQGGMAAGAGSTIIGLRERTLEHEAEIGLNVHMRGQLQTRRVVALGEPESGNGALPLSRPIVNTRLKPYSHSLFSISDRLV
jgi:hypothetical protein